MDVIKKIFAQDFLCVDLGHLATVWFLPLQSSDRLQTRYQADLSSSQPRLAVSAISARPRRPGKCSRVETRKSTNYVGNEKEAKAVQTLLAAI